MGCCTAGEEGVSVGTGVFSETGLSAGAGAYAGVSRSISRRLISNGSGTDGLEKFFYTVFLGVKETSGISSFSVRASQIARYKV